MLKKIYSKLFHTHLNTNSTKSSLKIISIFLMIFLLFNSGWVSEVVIKDTFPPCIYIGKERIMNGEDISSKLYLYDKYPFDCDVFSAQWLLKNTKPEDSVIPYISIYTDKARSMTKNPFPYIAAIRTGGSHPIMRTKTTYYCIRNTISSLTITNIHRYQGGYLYIRSLNTKEGIIETSVYPNYSWNYTCELYPVLNISNKIYTNGGSVIYYR